MVRSLRLGHFSRAPLRRTRGGCLGSPDSSLCALRELVSFITDKEGVCANGRTRLFRRSRALEL